LTQPHQFRRIVWPLAVAETVVWAAMFYGFPALMPAWEADLGWSKTELYGAFTSALVVAALLAPVNGRLVDHGHGRKAFVGGAVLGATMLVLLSQVTEPWQFYAVWIGIGVAMSGTLYEACFATLTHSMGPGARRAITLVTLVAGLAGTVSFPSAHMLTELVGWRGTVLVFAGAILVIAVPLIWSACRLAEGQAETHALAPSPSARQALSVVRSRTFWLLAIAFTALTIDHVMIISHILTLLADRGIHSQTAVLAASMIGPMQVAGRLAMMAAERHVSIRLISLGCFAAVGLAAAALLGAAAVPGLIVGFVIFQGAGFGVESIIKPLVTATLLGRRNFGVVAGVLAVAVGGGAALAPTVAAVIWRIGGYDLVIMAALALVAIALTALAAAWRSAPAADDT
jgi:MFS family permease